MKKILSIFILAVAGILSAAASQTFTVTSVSNSQTIYFRISKTSGSVTRSKTSNSGTAGTVSLTVSDTVRFFFPTLKVIFALPAALGVTRPF